MGSIAFPSLGVGNLGYSPQCAATMICEEIIAFRNLNPQSSAKYMLVIFDSKVYEKFKKTLASIMAGDQILSSNIIEVLE